MLREAESKSQGYWALQTLRRVPSPEADGVGLWGLGFSEWHVWDGALGHTGGSGPVSSDT